MTPRVSWQPGVQQYRLGLRAVGNDKAIPYS